MLASTSVLEFAAIYAADLCNARMVMLPQGASGTVDPVRVIAGPSTGLHRPFDVAIFGNELYVLDVKLPDSSIPVFTYFVLVYPLDADGDVAPRRVITGTALVAPLGLVVF